MLEVKNRKEEELMCRGHSQLMKANDVLRGLPKSIFFKSIFYLSARSTFLWNHVIEIPEKYFLGDLDRMRRNLRPRIWLYTIVTDKIFKKPLQALHFLKSAIFFQVCWHENRSLWLLFRFYIIISNYPTRVRTRTVGCRAVRVPCHLGTVPLRYRTILVPCH